MHTMDNYARRLSLSRISMHCCSQQRIDYTPMKNASATASTQLIVIGFSLLTIVARFILFETGAGDATNLLAESSTRFLVMCRSVSLIVKKEVIYAQSFGIRVVNGRSHADINDPEPQRKLYKSTCVWYMHPVATALGNSNQGGLSLESPLWYF